MPEMTYIFSFYDRNGEKMEDEIEFTTKAQALENYRLFVDPDNAEIYTKIVMVTYNYRTHEEKTVATIQYN